MQFLVLVLSICSLTAAALLEEELQQEWLNFKVKYGKKSRNAVEDSQRFVNFKNNYLKIKQHNQRYEQGLESYDMSVNPFTDMDFNEMQQSYMGLKMPENALELRKNSSFYQPTPNERTTIPSRVDWRASGAVTPVKDQKACGSCWAFAAAAALESHYYLKYKQTVLLSEQNFVDCVSKSSGCNGGWTPYCYEYGQKSNGINPQSIYPYEAKNGACRHRNNIGPINKSYREISNEANLQVTVALVGPVSVAIDANSNFMNYRSGIFNDPNCSKNVNHAVLVVGYGTENGQDYWLVKNSWSKNWGESGYIRMARNKGNQCAIATYGSYPIF